VSLTLGGFNTLVEAHAEALYRIAYRMVGDRHEAEDMVQEAFRSAWRSRESYQAGLGDRAWLAAILRRRIIDRYRRKPPPQTTSSQQEIDVEVIGADPLADDYTDEMQHALDQLPAELREALLLVVVGELTHQEAADLLNVPLGTMLSRVSRGRNRLRELLLSGKPV
jgi:RNA polymerase sigma-70 factor (ECF subfamily)